MGTQHLVLDLDLVEREEEGATTDKQLGTYRLRARMQQTGCGECVATLLLGQRPVLLESQPHPTGKTHRCLVLSTALDIQTLRRHLHNKFRKLNASTQMRPSSL